MIFLFSVTTYAQTQANTLEPAQSANAARKPQIDVLPICWQPTIYWLNQQIPQVHFVLHPLDLDGMTQEIGRGQLRVLNPLNEPQTQCEVSTPLYPNWSFAKTERGSSQLAKQISRALLAMPADNPCAPIKSGHGRCFCLSLCSTFTISGWSIASVKANKL